MNSIKNFLKNTISLYKQNLSKYSATNILIVILTIAFMFIDDFEDNLDIGIRKKLNVIMLDRENKKDSKYKKISNLVELEKNI